MNSAFTPVKEFGPSGFMLSKHKWEQTPKNTPDFGAPRGQCMWGSSCKFSLSDKVQQSDVGKAFGEIVCTCRAAPKDPIW